MSSPRNNSDIHEIEAHSQLTAQQKLNVNIISGLFTGMFSSGLFNPWDRALYLSVKENRPFLSIENFKSPYQGFSQALVQRAISGSIYYILQAELKSHMYPYLRNNIGVGEPTAQFCVGLLAGSMSGILTNSISAVKYHTWGQENRAFFSSVSEMWSMGGYKPFIKGTTATVSRDMVFGSTYEVLRHLMKHNLTRSDDKISNVNNTYIESICNAAAAAIATITSGPLNYVRNIQYATPPELKSPTISKALCDVWNESKNHNHRPLGRILFFQQKFRIGWGTANVAVRMAFGQILFDFSRSKIEELYSNSSRLKK